MAESIKKTDIAESDVLANLIPTAAQLAMIDKLDAAYQSLATNLKSGVGNYKDNLSAMQKQAEIQAQLTKLTKEKSAIDKERLRLEREISQALIAEEKVNQQLKKTEAERIKTSLQQIRLDAQISKTEAERIKTAQQQQRLDTQILKEKERLEKQSIRQAIATEKETAKTIEGNRAYNVLSRQLNTLRKEYKDVAITQGENSKAAQNLLKQITPLDAKLKKLDATVGQNQRSVGNYTKAVQGLTGVLGKLGIAFGLIQLKNFLVDLNSLAQESQGVQYAFDRLGVAGVDAFDRIKESTRGLLSDIDIQRALVNFDNFNISLEQTDVLMEFLAVRATQTGESIEKLQSSLVEGLSKESKLRIDNLGISTAELNAELEKTPNFVEAVANIAKREVAEAAGILDDAANGQERWNAQLDNFKRLLANGVKPIFDKAFSVGAQVLEFVGDNLSTIVKVLSTGLKVWIAWKIQTKLLGAELAKINIGNFSRMMTVLFQRTIPNLIKGFKGASLSAKTFGTALKSIPIFAVVSGLIALYDLFTSTSDAIDDTADATANLEREATGLNRVNKETEKNLNIEAASLTNVFDKLKATTAGTKERKEALDQVNKDYGLTLQNLSDEGEFVRQLDVAYDNLINQMERKIRLQLVEEEVNKLLTDRIRLEKISNQDLDTRARIQKQINELQNQFVMTGDPILDSEANKERNRKLNELQKKLEDLNNADVTGGSIAIINKQIEDLRSSVDDLVTTDFESKVKPGGSINSKNTSTKKEDYIDQSEIEEQRLFDLEVQRQKDLADLEQENERIREEAADAELKRIEDINEAQENYAEQERQRIKDEIEAEKKKQEELAQLRQEIQQQITDGLEAQFDKRISLIQKEADAREQQADFLKDLAASGNITAKESLKEEIEAQREAQKELYELERKKATLKMITTGLNTFSAEIDRGKTPAEALASTIISAEALKAVLSGMNFFAKGTDDAPKGVAVVDEKGAEIHLDKQGNIKSFGSDKGANFRHLDKGDKIITHDKSLKILDYLGKINEPKKHDFGGKQIENFQTIKELKTIANILKSKSDSAVFDPLFNEVVRSSTNNNVRIKNRYRK